jgi:hypothetical protein
VMKSRRLMQTLFNARTTIYHIVEMGKRSCAAQQSVTAHVG